MSTRNLGPQFAESLHDVPATPSSRVGTPDQHVRHVPLESLRGAVSGEYAVPVGEIGQARSQRLSQDDLSHPGDHPGAQEALEESVSREGVRDPILLDYQPPPSMDQEGEWSVTNGSHRLLAAQRTGQTHVPVVRRF